MQEQGPVDTLPARQSQVLILWVLDLTMGGAGVPWKETWDKGTETSY